MMGSDDVRFKFGTDSDPDRWVEADWTQLGSIYAAESGPHIQYQSINDGGFYIPVFRNIPSEEWEAWTRLRGAGQIANRSIPIAWIKLDDGFYYVVGLTSGGSSDMLYTHAKQTTRPDTTFTGGTSIPTPFGAENTNIWVGLRFKTNGNVDIIKDITLPTVIDSDIFTYVLGSKLLEVGVWGGIRSTPATAAILEIRTEADLPTPLGGDATLENPIDIVARTSLGSMGVANMEFIEKDLASKIDTIISNHRKSVSINVTKNGMAVMIGEIIHTPHQLTNYGYRVEEISRKLLRTPTLTDPVKEDGFIRHIGKDPVVDTKTIIDDIDKDFTVNVNVNDLVTFQQETTSQLKATPDFAGIQWWDDQADDTFIPTGTTGTISNCYFDDQSLAVADNQIGGKWILGDKSGLVIFFYFPIKVGNSATKLIFDLTVAFRKLSKFGSAGALPPFFLWNYDTSDFNTELYQLQYEDVGGKNSTKDDDDVFGLDESTDAHLTIEYNDDVDNHIDQITANSGDDEFNRFEVKLFIQTTADNESMLWASVQTIHLYFAQLTIELLAEQDGLLELGKVGAVAANRLDFQDFLGRQPFMDGISNDDKYFVTDVAEDVLANALANSSLDDNFTLDIDATGIASLSIFQDFTDKSFWDLLQFVCQSLNGFWYINPSTKAITIRTSDTAEDTGIELDETDVYNFHDQIFNNMIDSSNLRTKIKVIGDKVDSGNVSISPEFGSTFGDETEIIDRADAETITEVSDIANAQATRHAKANRLMTFPINITNNSKNLSALSLGKLITVKIPADGSIIDYSGDDKVLIYSMDYEKTERTGQEEILYLQLQRRY